MRSDEERRLDRLLSGTTGPSVNEREAMQARILPRASLLGAAGLSRWLRFGVPALAGAAACLLLLLYWNPDRGGFTARGDGRAAFRLVCVPAAQLAAGDAEGEGAGAGPVTCRRGDTLAFVAESPERRLRYLSAAALGPEGTLVWYFPSDERGSLLLDESSVAKRGIVLGAEHNPGAYRVFSVLTAAPVARQDLRRWIEDRLAGKASEADLIESEFVVRP
ncbi:MAG: hypothetical protein GYA21_19490 [Myxococcales bacterium]|nr:hypothetical protein [Myxococcales bacterium]